MKKITWKLMLWITAIVLIMTACNSKQIAKQEEREKVIEEGGKANRIGIFAKEVGVIHVGTDGGYFPYCFVDDADGVLKGFEVDLFNAIGEKINTEVDIQVVKWQGAFGLLETGKVDTLAIQVSETPERKEKYDFSDPYMYTSIRLAVQKGKESSIREVHDLEGKKVACNSSGRSFDRLTELQKEVKFEIIPYDVTGMEMDLNMGRVDALYSSEVATRGAIKKGNFSIDFAECKPLDYEVNAYPLRRDDRSKMVKELINYALQEMRDDGSLRKLSEKWFEADLSVKQD